ncbi:hypothetical protein TMEN_8244 [Trichophyton mentagrophytes]|nr:hypothetical protein H101_00260 [Trichophyton interdigitale H6]GBF65527.1 hypothetical protein TMEN_8244 [Trichophyton mentagrophytes]
MAPRHRRSNGSSCDSHAFESLESIVDLTFLALFFVIGLILVYIYILSRKRARRNGHAKEGALWTVLALSLGAELIVHTLDLVNSVYGECSSALFTDLVTILTIGIASTCLKLISGFLLLAATLLPITRLMYECAGGIVPRVSSISNKILVVLMGADLIACIALLIWLITDTNVDMEVGANRFFKGISSGLTGIFFFLYNILGLLGSLMGFVSHILAIRKAPQLRRSGKLRTLAHLLTIVQFAQYVVQIVVLWVNDILVGYILQRTLLLVTIATALYYVPSAELAAANNAEPPRYEQGAEPPVYSTQYAPLNMFPRDEAHYSQSNASMTETYDVPPIPPVGKPQELPGGYTEVPQQPDYPPQPSLPSYRNYGHPVELPYQANQSS